MRKTRKALLLLLAAGMLLTFSMAEETEIHMNGGAAPSVEETKPEATAIPESGETEEKSARDALIDDYIETGRQVYEKAGGKLQRAHYAGDIYVCKNFTTYVFSQNADKYRLAEYPGVHLSVPANQKAEDCKPYSYGYRWKDVSPEDGNPFEVAAQFLYDPDLTKAENMELALAFMRQVKKGDYFQMSADYYYGKGAHSAVMIADYDPDTDTVHWMDSNMKGEKKDGIRYGLVQFDAEKPIEWWADAFCHKGRGATIYRLRDDIMFAE